MAVDGDFQKLQQLATKIDKARKAFEPKFTELGGKLDAAIKDKNRELVEVYLATLEAKIVEIEATNKDLDSATIELFDVQSDKEFVAAHLEALEKTAETIHGGKAAYAKHFQSAKRLQNAAQEIAYSQAEPEEAALRELARIDSEAKDNAKQFQALFAKADAAAERASKANDSGNAKALADAKKAFPAMDIDIAVTMLAGFVKRIDEFEKWCAQQKVSEDVKADLADGISDVRVALKSTQYTAGLLQEQAKRVEGFEVKTVDVKKALKSLELDGKFEGKLAKVLAGPSSGWEKGLTALAKEAKLETDGKEMLAKLKKDKVV